MVSASFQKVFAPFTKSERRIWWRVIAGGVVVFFLLDGAFRLFEQVAEHDCAEEVQLAVVECRNAIDTLERQIEMQNERLDTLWELRTAGSILLPGVLEAPEMHLASRGGA